ncbi:MAG: uroporphyrinogen-III C-methyltransferase [Planctomycetaceae bacterium]
MNTGKVYLVGAGPGDPGLITLRGRDILAAADLVLYDGLANPLLLRFTKAVCERTARTRVGSDAIVPQQEINERLIQAARKGLRVVRLKGGDPYIFGRGSEEAAALEAAHIPYEVVPGITAATAAGEYAGFSFTHRDIASAVAFVTGHEDPSRNSSRLDYAALAAFRGTLVFYMGLGRIQHICNNLMHHGMPATTPAAVICQASLPGQQVVTSTLERLATDAAKQNLRPPSLIVVGDCVNLRRTTSWFESRPLFGQRIGVTRPAQQCDSIADTIVRMSGQPVIMPMIEINAVDDIQQAVVDQTLGHLDDFQWLVFTSVNGVDAFFKRLWANGMDARAIGHMQLATIGSSTAAALEERGLRADVVPDSFRAEALAEQLVDRVSGQNVLWARANRGRDVLPTVLNQAGAAVTELVVYRNDDVEQFDAQIVEQLRSGELHWVGLSSPSIARRFASLLNAHGLNPSSLRTQLAAISPVTAAAAKDAGLSVAVEATTYTWDGIVSAIAASLRA